MSWRECNTGPELTALLRKRHYENWKTEQLAKMEAKGKTPRSDAWTKKYKVVPQAEQVSSLPDGWCWERVDVLAVKVTDGVHKKPNYVQEGVPFITVRNLTAGLGIDFENVKYITPEAHEDYIRRTYPEEGDILISKDGTLGVVRQVKTDRKFSIFVSVALVKPVRREMSDYLEHAFRAPQIQAQMGGTGTGLLHIHLKDLRQVHIPVAPPHLQTAIVAKIEDLTARSRAAKQALDAIPPLLERFRQSVLAAAFRGDLTKQWRHQNPNTEPATELLKRIRQERRHRWEQDYLEKQKAKGKQPKNDKWKEKYKEPEPVISRTFRNCQRGGVGRVLRNWARFSWDGSARQRIIPARTWFPTSEPRTSPGKGCLLKM